MAQGPILAFIYAVKELQQAAARDGRGGGGLGANIAFVFEGEEENGSGGFRDAVRQNMQWCVLKLLFAGKFGTCQARSSVLLAWLVAAACLGEMMTPSKKRSDADGHSEMQPSYSKASGSKRKVRLALLCRFEGTQLVVISNTLWVGEQVPCLTYGMRGMISLSIEARFDALSLTPVCSMPARVQHTAEYNLLPSMVPSLISASAHSDIRCLADVAGQGPSQGPTLGQ